MSFLTEFLYPLMSAVATTTVAAGVGIAYKKMGIDQASSDNTRIQSAVANYAGPIVNDIITGKISLDDVKNGHGVAGLVEYLNTTTLVPALGRLNITPATLGVMLAGKVIDKLTTPAIPAVAPPSN